MSDKARELFQQGVKALPQSQLLVFSLADFEESHKRLPAAVKVPSGRQGEKRPILAEICLRQVCSC
jgi:hypothetical protein